jgi:hypothetical protein
MSEGDRHPVQLGARPVFIVSERVSHRADAKLACERSVSVVEDRVVIPLDDLSFGNDRGPFEERPGAVG